MSLFTEDQALVESGVSVLYLMAVNQIFLNAYIVMSGALRGAGDTGAVMRITSMRLWLIFVPMTYVLIQYTGFGVSSVWVAEITSFFVFLLFLVRRFHSRKWADIVVE